MLRETPLFLRLNPADDVVIACRELVPDEPALRIVAGGVNHLQTTENAIIVVTHYQRLLNYIVPDFVHVLASGRIAREGGKELALELEAKGYDWIKTADNKDSGAALAG